MRALSNLELDNIRTLTKNSVEFTLIEPTRTGLEKSIMDATGAVRVYLKDKGIHDYSLQRQGPEHKIMIKSSLLDYESVGASVASLYRPETKSGDPRIWFKGLNQFTKPNDILCIAFYNSEFYLINISTTIIEDMINSAFSNPIKDLLFTIRDESNIVSKELLQMLKNVAKEGPVKAMLSADTAVGRTLEMILGININSSKKPDYKGIEIKSYRESRGNRKTLFAQVSDWNLSKFKSSAELLDAFGYSRGNDYKLYCTVSTIVRNSQGLKFKIDTKLNQLIENSENASYGDVLVWTLEKLHQRLLEKHNETFWIAAESRIIDGEEYFQYNKVEHTRKPIVSQFDILLEQGLITMDHLIKRNIDGRVSEKGPLFKIKPDAINLLFPPSLKYSLI